MDFNTMIQIAYAVESEKPFVYRSIRVDNDGDVYLTTEDADGVVIKGEELINPRKYMQSIFKNFHDKKDSDDFIFPYGLRETKVHDNVYIPLLSLIDKRQDQLHPKSTDAKSVGSDVKLDKIISLLEEMIANKMQ
jgi:hypothetical protein